MDIEYKDVEFKVEQILENGITIDMTEYFTLMLTNPKLNKIFITWKTFEKVAVEGSFIVTAPKNTGLYYKYGSEWFVKIKRDKTLLATLRKIYTERVEEDGN